MGRYDIGWDGIFWKETVGLSASSMQIIGDIDWALEALEIIDHAHDAAVEGLTYWPEDVLVKWSVEAVSEAKSRHH